VSLLGKPHKIKPDLDNLLKGVFDCLSENADSHVYEVWAKKIWGEEGQIKISSLAEEIGG
jgi:Holliday junction resolvase RusA-like endonuclease